MKYLNRLKSEKGLSEVLQKLQKAPFYSYCSTEGRLISENIPLPLPFFGPDGGVVIPFGSDPRFHWWAGGQSTTKTEEEIRGWRH